MRKKLSLIVRYYGRSFMPFMFSVSLFSWAIVGAPQSLALVRFLPLYLLLKILSGGLLWYYQKRTYPLRLFFYTNLSITEVALYVTIFFLDISIFAAFILVFQICNGII